MYMIRDNRQSALHRFPAHIQMPRLFLRRLCRHRDKAREAVSVNDHLNQVLQLIVSFPPLYQSGTSRWTYTVQALRLGNPHWVPAVRSLIIILPIPRQYPLPLF